MATKQINLDIKTIGLPVSVVLAVIYTLVMFASLILVGLRSSGSWQATLLGIAWNTVVGFEFGLLGIVIVGFAVAAAFVPACNFIRRRVPNRSKSLERMTQSDPSSSHSRSFRLLAALLVLLPLTLLMVRVVAWAMSFGVTTGAEAAMIKGPDARTAAVNIGPIINTVYREAEPSFTADGRTMYFNCYTGDICISHLSGTWEQGNWSAPERLAAPISTEYEEVEPVINGTGDKLYFTSNRPDGVFKNVPFLSPFVNVFEVVNTISSAALGRTVFGGLGLPHLWVSYRINGAWSEPENINNVAGEPHINTPFADHCLFFSADGNEAFWTSTRPGGYGHNDIWTSHRVNGQWTEPENLGPNVNTSKNEHAPIPTPDGKSLYVTSDRPDGYGGEDIYITTRDADGKWGPLVNLGPLVNGPGDDRCPAWTPDLKIFLVDSIRKGGFGGRDIWWIYFKDIN